MFRDWEDQYKASDSVEENIMEHFDIRRIKLNQQLMKKYGYIQKEQPEEEETSEKDSDKIKKEKK